MSEGRTLTDKERDARIAELWESINHNESLLAVGAQPFDVLDTSTHPYDMSDWDVLFLLIEVDRLRKKLGLKPLQPKKAKK